MVVNKNLEDNFPSHLESKELINIHQVLSQFENIEFKYFTNKIEIKEKSKKD